MNFDLEQHRRERVGTLERENRMLAAERRRLERIVAAAVRRIAAQPGPWVRLDFDDDDEVQLVECEAPSPTTILGWIAAEIGADLARPAWVEEAEHEAVRARQREDDEADARFWRTWRELAA